MASSDGDTILERGRLRMRGGQRCRKPGPQIESAGRHLKLQPAAMLSQRRDQGVAALPAARPQSGQMTLEVSAGHERRNDALQKRGRRQFLDRLGPRRRSRAADGPTSQPIRELALEIFDMLP